MSMVNADSVQLFAMLKKMQDSISSIETTKKSVKMKYEQLGAGWQDKKYNELGVVVRDCNKALNDILVIMLQAEKYVALLAKSLSEYESVQLGSTNGISASTPQTSSFAVTPSSADTTTLWVKFCMLFLMWSMRQNEYLADEFAYKIGFGLELATVLDQHISDVPHDGFLSAIYSTHPCNDDRVAALQNLGVPYSRY